MLRNQRGQGMIEYILIVALVVVGAIGLWMAFGDNMTGMLNDANQGIDKAHKEMQKDLK